MAINSKNDITTKVEPETETMDALDPKVRLQVSLEGVIVPFQNSTLPYQNLYLSFEETFIQYASFSAQQLEAEYEQFLNTGEEDFKFLDLEFEQLFDVPVSGGAELAELLLVVNEGTVQSVARDIVAEPSDDSRFKGITSKERDLSESSNSEFRAPEDILPLNNEPVVNVNVDVDVCSLVVNTTMDVVSSADSLNSLREAINCANAHAGTDTITLGAGTYTLSLAGTGESANATGDLDVTDSLIIEGAGAANTIIDAADIDRVLEVVGIGTSLTLRNLTITGGNLIAGQGAGVLTTSGTLTVENVIFTDNESSGTASAGAIALVGAGATGTIDNSLFDANKSGGSAGAILVEGNASDLTVNNSTFQNNTATLNGGAISIAGSTTSSINNSLFTDNQGRNGGALYINGMATITNSIFDSNDAIPAGVSQGDGGAIAAFSNAVVNISNSTISNNTSDDGGGLLLRNSASVTITNSTISGNSATDIGGGIRVRNSGTLDVFNSTITLNQSSNPAGGTGGIFMDSGTVELTSTIVAGNITAGNQAFADVRDRFGNATETSGGNNLIGIDDGAPGFSGGAGDQSGTAVSPLDSKLGVLQDNGGFTAGETSTAQTVQTHLADVGSPVIDMGSNTQTLTNDQRGAGFAREDNGTADIGAVETSVTCSLVVDTTTDVVNAGDAVNSLREAIDCANMTAGTDTITLGAGTYTLLLAGAGEDANATGDFDVTDSLIIEGAGAGSTIIDGADLDRLFHVLGAGTTLTLRNLTVQEGNVADNGGAVFVEVDNSIIIEDATISANEASRHGGAIFALAGTTTKVTNALFDNNSAVGRDGGAIRIVDSVANAATVTVNNSTFQNNTAARGGGAINSHRGTITTINDSLFDSNSTGAGGGPWGGGAVYLFGGDTNIDNSIFSGNKVLSANGDGGAIKFFGGSNTSIFSNSTFSGNEAGDRGGAIMLAGASSTITNTTFSSNNATAGGAIHAQSGDIDIFNTTITGNDGVGGGINVRDGQVEFASTIIAGNTVGGVGTSTTADLNIEGSTVGTFTSQGNNIVGVLNASLTPLGSDQTGTAGTPLDAQLGALQNNGGFLAGETSTQQTVQTHLPDAGSPVIDMGSNTQALTTDQRGAGFAREDNGTADIGAVENIPPVILDLDGDGIELVSAANSSIIWTSEDGSVFKTGWVGADDGILVYDENQDGQFSGLEEIQLASYHVDAKTDLEGLALAFDSNQDGVFDAQDAEFSQFAIWQDINQDGVSQANEFTSIIDSTVESIYLTSDGIQSIVEGNIVYGTSYYLDTSGNSYAVGDVGLQILDVFEDTTIDSSLDTSLPESIPSESANEAYNSAQQNNAVPNYEQNLDNSIEQQNNPNEFGV